MYGSAYQEMEDEFFGRYDAVSEAYAATATGLYDEAEAEWQDEANRLISAKEAGELVLHYDTFYEEERVNWGLGGITIPPAWKAGIVEDIDCLFDDHTYVTRVIEGIGKTEEEAIEMLVGQLKALGLTGKLRKA